MSAQAISAQDIPDDNQLTVSFRLLLGLYAIIPLCLLLQLFDGWFWQGFLQQSLPSSPKQFLLFQIIFGTPHIVASSILLAGNTEYLKFYKLKIILMTVAIITVFGVGSLFIPYKAFYVTVAAWTVYHVLKQQLGVGRSLYRLPDRFGFLSVTMAERDGGSFRLYRHIPEKQSGYAAVGVDKADCGSLMRRTGLQCAVMRALCDNAIGPVLFMV